MEKRFYEFSKQDLEKVIDVDPKSISGLSQATVPLMINNDTTSREAGSLALGNICTGATFACLTLTERKKGTMENSMKVWATQETLPQLL